MTTRLRFLIGPELLKRLTKLCAGNLIQQRFDKKWELTYTPHTTTPPEPPEEDYNKGESSGSSEKLKNAVSAVNDGADIPDINSPTQADGSETNIVDGPV